jgi:hypothetical protein
LSKKFRILDVLKNAFAIVCLFCILLTTSSISYFYWLEEALHEKDTFALIDAGKLNAIKENEHQIKLVLNDKDLLPDGYTWEEEGREFSYKGMFYDIISLKKTANGWELIAASDEEEADMVAKQSSHSKSLHFKFSKIQLLFIAPNYFQSNYLFNLSNIFYTECHASITHRTIRNASPPPERI